jgi:hypothetical protein
MLIELRLTSDQQALLEPFVREASGACRNLIFIATAAPQGEVWRFQVMDVSPVTGSKIVRLIKPELRLALNDARLTRQPLPKAGRQP